MKAETAGRQTAYPPSPTGLAIFWLEVLEMAYAGDDTGVADRLSTLQCRREDLEELFGLGAGQRLWSDYARAFASFAGEGAAEISRKIRERRYDDVEVVPLTGARELPPAERKTAEPLRTNSPVYAVRLKRSEEEGGIRIDTFVFLDGAWRTGLKVGCS